jgi:hypothetical protein
VVLALLNPLYFFRAYLVGYQFWLGVALGSMVLLMLQYLTGGGWGILLRRILEAASRTLPLLVLLALPLVPGVVAIYPWAAVEERDFILPTGHVENVPHEENEFRATFLSLPFFAVRTVIYFAIWGALMVFLNRWSRVQDEGAPVARRLRGLSGAGLVLYGLTITFAAVDWLMSLEPDWVSTIYPPLFGVGQVLAGMAFALAVLLAIHGLPLTSHDSPLTLRPQHLRDLGNMLLTFVMLWAYMSFSQFLLIWAENLPEEIPWYLRRTHGGWEIVAVLLLLVQFGLPFFLLLSRQVKDNPRSLALVAVIVLVMHFVDLLWWVQPANGSPLTVFCLMDVSAWLAIGGLWLWWFVRELRTRPLLPLGDPYLLEYLPDLRPQAGEAANHA